MMMGNKGEAVLNKPNLDKIKHFILENGETCTYCQRYNNNPCFSTEKYYYYLDPDPGGPANHPQWNINCDPKKGDFNILVIRRNINTDASMAAFKDQYVTVKFNNPNNIQIENVSGNQSMETSELKEFPEAAIKEIFVSIDKSEKRNQKDR